MALGMWRLTPSGVQSKREGSDPDTARAFGDVIAVPTMLMFDQSGKLAKALYGAPPNLHEEAEKVLSILQERSHE